MSTTLNSGSLLQSGRYRIERVLGQGGFGITYLATHTGFDQKVALKEFYMKELCVRNEETSFVTLGTGESSATVERFRGKFLKEARNLFRLNHKHIVRVLDIFEENGTAYFAMEYAEGGSLSQKVKAEGALPEAVATRYILQVAEALAYLHEQKMNHLDVKPANIMLNNEDDAVLIDFGLAKQYDATGGQTSTTPAGISEGYAPMEQYKLGGVAEFTPETDIYALGATFFKLLTGVTPPSAQDVFEDGVPVETLRQHGVSEAAIAVIEQAMKPSMKVRMNSAKAFVEGLSSAAQVVKPEVVHALGVSTTSGEEEATKFSESVEIENVTDHAPQPKPQPTKAPNSNKWWIIGVAVTVIVFGAVFLLLKSKSGNETILNEAVSHGGSLNGHYYVDLGLPSGTLWATCNVGASTPEEYGDYFAWGETKPKDCYSDSTYFDTSDGKTFQKYNNNGGKTELDLSDDAAYVNWGEGWRIPSEQQLNELRSECTWTWCSIKGVDGHEVKSKNNNNSIFLPAAGNYYEGSLHLATCIGDYWSRSLNAIDSRGAFGLGFDMDHINWDDNNLRINGYSIRPVCVK